jgi:methyl-accepting chemotaxis protein
MKNRTWLHLHIVTLSALTFIPVLIQTYFNVVFGFILLSNIILVLAGLLTLMHVSATQADSDPITDHQDTRHIMQIMDTVKSSSNTLIQSAQSLEELMEHTHLSASDIALMMEGITNMALKNTQLSKESAHQMHILQEHIDVIKTQTQSLDALSEDAQQESSNGQMIVAELITQSEKTNRSMESLGASIREIGFKMKNMHKITETILSISNKTHLLALNAAIESARAGEHGLGFSVVAKEIGNLADQSKQSSTMIQNLIGGVTAQMEDSLVKIDEVETALENQINSVTSTLTAFGSIGISIVEIGSGIDAIHDLAMNIDSIKSELGEIVDQVTLSSQMTSATTEQATLSGKSQLQSFEKASVLCSDLKRISSTLTDTSETLIANAS